MSDNYQKEITPYKQLTVVDIIPPTILDSSSIPFTEKNFIFKITFIDNIALSESHISYWFDDKNNEPMNITNVSENILIPSNAHILNYDILVRDISQNSAFLSVKKEIIDVIPPNITIIFSQPRTNKSLNFKCNITDNWNLKYVNLSYWFNESIISTVMRLNGTLFEINISIPPNATVIHYNISALDLSGNIEFENGILIVLDDILPEIIDITLGEPRAGDSYIIHVKVNDNIGIKKVYLKYWIDEKESVINMSLSGNIYSIRIDIPNQSKRLSYQINALDVSDNNAKTQIRRLDTTSTNSYVNHNLIIILFLLFVCSIICIIIISEFHRNESKVRKENRKHKKRSN
jgi:hypothetical protein